MPENVRLERNHALDTKEITTKLIFQNTRNTKTDQVKPAKWLWQITYHGKGIEIERQKKLKEKIESKELRKKTILTHSPNKKCQSLRAAKFLVNKISSLKALIVYFQKISYEEEKFNFFCSIADLLNHNMNILHSLVSQN